MTGSESLFDIVFSRRETVRGLIHALMGRPGVGDNDLNV
jgi:hypothetical protein